MWGQLGSLRFTIEPAARDLRRAFEYEELRVIEGKPRLQWMADALQEQGLELVLHRQLGDPEARMSALRAAAASHEAQSFVLGTGEVLGDFVITELSETCRHDDADGRPIALDVRVALKEFVPADPLLVVQLRAKAAAKKAQSEASREQTVWDRFGDEEMAELAGGQSVLPPEEDSGDPESSWAGIAADWQAAFGG